MRRPPPKLVQRLVSASEEVLRPDQALRLEDIATLIGSARATLYYHFSGRDDLVAFLLEEHLRVAAETIELAVTTTRPPVVQLRSAITALVGFLGGQPEYAPACSPSREPPDDWEPSWPRRTRSSPRHFESSSTRAPPPANSRSATPATLPTPSSGLH